jgi:hypothetical protein
VACSSNAIRFAALHGDPHLRTAFKSAFAARIVKTGQGVILLAGHPIEGGDCLSPIRFVWVGTGGNPVEP